MPGPTITLTFAGESKKLSGELDKVGKATETFGDKFKKVNRAAVVASTAVIGAAAGIGKALISAGEEGESVERVVDNTFKKMGGAMSDTAKEWRQQSKDMSKSIGRPITDINRVQGQLATFGKVWEDPVKGAENFERATILAFDLERTGFGEAQSNITQLGKALQDPTKGMSALAESGVTFTAAEQEKIKALQESGQLLAAQEILYKGIEAQVGGAAEAGATGSEKMMASFENLKDTLGRALLPAFTALSGAAASFAVFAEENRGVVVALGATLTGLAAAILVVNGAVKAARAAVVAWTAVQWLLNVALTANPIGLVIAAIAALVAGIVIAWRHSETFRNVVKGAMRGIVTAFNWVTDKGGQLIDWFRSVPGKIGSFFSGLGNAIAAPFRTAFDWVRSAWNATVGGFGFDVPSWVPGVGGNSFRIPTMHSGGTVPGAPGSETLALLQAGERVTPTSQTPKTVTLRSDGSSFSDLVIETLRKAVADEGGNVQIALGR